MHWFRRRIGPGAVLALIALALQLVLTLGHTHAGELDGHHQSAAHAQQAALPDEASPSDHQPSPGAFCPDCFVLAQAATGLMATPPTLPALASVGTPLAVLCALPGTPARRCAGFRPRAPPQS